jgi:hypothetical protein
MARQPCWREVPEAVGHAAAAVRCRHDFGESRAAVDEILAIHADPGGLDGTGGKVGNN